MLNVKDGSMSGTNVLDRARKALVSSPISTLRRLRVDVLDDAVVISGRVGSFYEKQMAQEAIRAACSDVQVNNTIDVS